MVRSARRPGGTGRRQSAVEIGTVRKKWTGLAPVALLFPNTFAIGSANLGMQIVYHRLNQMDAVVCERFFLPEDGRLRSRESDRPLHDFPLIFCALSFEHDYLNLVRMLVSAGLGSAPEERSGRVAPGSPLVVMGGVAVTINPEPLALFADCMVIGEAEPVLAPLMALLIDGLDRGVERAYILAELARVEGCYLPTLYEMAYDDEGRVLAVTPKPGAPDRVRRQYLERIEVAEHSHLLSPESEMNLYMTEMGRGCGRACRFCAAGFVYRPPRLWPAEAVELGLDERPEGIHRVGLLGMEMIEPEVMNRVAAWLDGHGCDLSFSSLRADRITDPLIAALGRSELKSAAIAMDGASRRLRLVINKGLDEEDLLAGALRLVEAGIVNLKLYVMLGLPTETDDDVEECIVFVERLRQALLAVGRGLGRVATLTLSVNSFVPKPWTPFQYQAFGGLDADEARRPDSEALALDTLRRRFRRLRRAFARSPHIRLKADRPEYALEQAMFARADRRLGPALHQVVLGGRSLARVLAEQGISPWTWALRPRERDERLPWEIIDQGIAPGYLWGEYQRALTAHATPPCEPQTCRRCGVCHGRS